MAAFPAADGLAGFYFIFCTTVSTNVFHILFRGKVIAVTITASIPRLLVHDGWMDEHKDCYDLFGPSTLAFCVVVVGAYGACFYE